MSDLLESEMDVLTEFCSKKMIESVSGKWYGIKKRIFYKRCHKLKLPFLSHLLFWKLLYVD